MGEVQAWRGAPRLVIECRPQVHCARPAVAATIGRGGDGGDHAQDQSAAILASAAAMAAAAALSVVRRAGPRRHGPVRGLRRRDAAQPQLLRALRLAAGHAGGKDRGDLLLHARLVLGDGLARLRRQRAVGGEQLGVAQHVVALGLAQRGEPLAQACRRWRAAVGDRLQRRHRPCQPALQDRLAQRRLAGEMPVHAAMADPERLRHVDHGRLAGAIASQHVFGSGEDAFGREYGVVHAADSSTSSVAQTSSSAT